MTGPLDRAPDVADGTRAHVLRAALAQVGDLGAYDAHVMQLLISAHCGPVVAAVASWVDRAYEVGVAAGRLDSALRLDDLQREIRRLRDGDWDR